MCNLSFSFQNRLGINKNDLPKYEEKLELNIAKAQLEELKKEAVEAMETQAKKYVTVILIYDFVRDSLLLLFVCLWLLHIVVSHCCLSFASSECLRSLISSLTIKRLFFWNQCSLAHITILV